MNDTENRLRDYLHTQATSTVPADAHGPGPELGESNGRRSWLPITAVAAAIGFTLLLAVPALTNLADRSHPGPAATPTPAPPTKGPVSGAAPAIPYTVAVQDNPDNPLDTWWSTLYDHGKTVKNPGTHGNVLGRFGADRWLIETGYPKAIQLAVLDAAGKVRPIGPKVAGGPVYSPDHTQLALTESLQFGTPQVRNRIIVLDPATGKELAGVVAPVPTLTAVGWTKDGLLLSSFDPKTPKVYRWQPGKGQPEEVHGVQQPMALQAIPATGKLLDFTAKGCPRLGTLKGNEFVAEREYCDAADTNYQSVVSPDGRTLFEVNAKVAVDLYTGATTTLRMPGALWGFPGAVFEDPTNLITVTDKAMYRCSVATGECKLLRVIKAKEILAVVTP
jgi:hypothetical protein